MLTAKELDPVALAKLPLNMSGNPAHKIVEQCEGCGKVIEYTSEKYCMVYPNPAGKWAVGGCPQATHKKVVKEESTQKVNPLKASKRAAKK